MERNSSRPEFINLSLSVKIPNLLLSGVLLIATTSGNLLLLKFYEHENRRQSFRNKTASFVILRWITLVSFVGSTFGITSRIIGVGNGFQPLPLCVIFSMEREAMFLSFSLCLHMVSCVTLDRFLTITGSRRKITNENVNRILAVLSAYVFISWLVIFTDIIIAKFVTNVMPVCIWHYESIYGLKGPRKTRSISIAIISVWIASCNIIINTATMFSIIFTRKASERQERTLGRAVRRLETRRLRVTVCLSVTFTIVWVPNGVVVGQMKNMDVQTYAIARMYLSTLSYASFLVLPVVYFFMDRRFEKYVRNALKRNEVVSHRS